MRSYDYMKRWQELLTPEIVSLLSAIHEYKGKQALYIEAKSDTLLLLTEISKIQSTDASNRIEGVYTSNERLKKIVMEKTTPKSRSEKEIAGYRDVLNTIHTNYDYIPVSPAIILQLHRDLYKYSGSAVGGKYKSTDNEISETDQNGEKITRFLPVAAWETPESLERLCEAYAAIMNGQYVDPLLIIPMFVLDFLCIHPFLDGNGRMSRLISLLMLYQNEYFVGKYISLERIINDSKDSYYEALQESSFKWHENENDYVPFVKYLLGVVLAAYREFSDRVMTLRTASLSKPEMIAEVIKEKMGKITKAEIMEKCPDISHITVQRTLKDLQDAGDIRKIGNGRYTSYIWNREKTE